MKQPVQVRGGMLWQTCCGQPVWAPLWRTLPAGCGEHAQQPTAACCASVAGPGRAVASCCAGCAPAPLVANQRRRPRHHPAQLRVWCPCRWLPNWLLAAPQQLAAPCVWVLPAGWRRAKQLCCLALLRESRPAGLERWQRAPAGSAPLLPPDLSARAPFSGGGPRTRQCTAGGCAAPCPAPPRFPRELAWPLGGPQRRDTDSSPPFLARPAPWAGRPAQHRIFPFTPTRPTHPSLPRPPWLGTRCPYPAWHTFPSLPSQLMRAPACPPDARGAFRPPALFSASMKILLPASRGQRAHPWRRPRPRPPAFVACCSNLFLVSCCFSMASRCSSPFTARPVQTPHAALPAASTSPFSEHLPPI